MFGITNRGWQVESIWYNKSMTNNNNNRENKMTTAAQQFKAIHINSIFSTMNGGYDAEIDRVNCHTGNAYRIIVQHLGETYVHYSSTEDDCYDYMYSIVR